MTRKALDSWVGFFVLLGFAAIMFLALKVASSACQVSFQKAFMRVLIDRLTQANAKLATR